MDFSVIKDFLPVYFTSIGVTFQLTFYALILGFLISLVLAVMKISKNKLLNGLAIFYTSIFRGIPLLVQVFIVYFGIPQLIGFNISSMQAASVTFALNSAAYISETLRGGIMAVDKGQWEASKALGIPYFAMMKDIILPQALKSILPGLVNESITLLKNTSLAATIGLVEVLRAGQLVMNSSFRAFEPLLFSGLIYYVIVTGMSFIAKQIEKKVMISDKR